MRPTASIVALAWLLVAGCDTVGARSPELLAALPLEARQYAGITISFPKGEVIKKTASYRSGEVVLERKKDAVVVATVTVSWQLGEPLYGDELQMVVDAVFGNLANLQGMKRGARWETSLGERTLNGIYYSGPKTAAVFGSFACGNRALFVAVVARGKQAELRTLLERIVLSTRCVDDEEAGQRALAPAFVPPPGFGYSAADSSVETVIFLGLDGSAFLFFQGGATDLLEGRKEVVGAVFEDVLGTVLPGLEFSDTSEDAVADDGSHRPVWHVRVPDGSGVFTLWWCESIEVSLGGMYLTDFADSVDVGKRALLSAVCPDPTEDPVAGYPTAEQVFEVACDAGDERGCATK